MTNEESPVMQKTRELCQTILEQPAMKSARQRIDAFLDDEPTRNQYQDLVSKSQELQQKQQNAEALSQDEIAQFERDRDALLENSVAKGFLDAQEEIHDMQHTISRYVSKTLDLGRIPAPDELSGGQWWWWLWRSRWWRLRLRPLIALFAEVFSGKGELYHARCLRRAFFMSVRPLCPCPT